MQVDSIMVKENIVIYVIISMQKKIWHYLKTVMSTDVFTVQKVHEYC